MADDVVLTVVARDLASRVLSEVRSELRALDRAAEQSGSAFRALGDMVRNVAAGIGVGVGIMAAQAAAALGDALRDGVDAASAFEAGLLRFSAVAGDSLSAAGVSLQEVQQLALDLGSATQYSAAEALDALTELVKGGVSVEDAMGGATKATLDLAAAAGLDLANAAEILSKQLGVWASTGVDAATVADLLAGAANASTVDVEELALGLANVSGTARIAGVSFNDTVQTLALIAPAFSSAADAGTSLKTFIASLVPQTNDATKAMIALGLATKDGKSKFFDASGQFVGMERAAAMLQQALAGLSEEQRLFALNTIFGADAIRAASMLAEAGATGFAAMGQAVQAAGGASAAAAQMQQGYVYALQELQGAWETLQIVAGSAVLPALTSIVQALRDGVQAVVGYVQAVQAGADPIAALGERLGLTADHIALVQNAMTQAGAAISATMTTIQTIANQALGALSALWQQHGAEITASTQQAWITISAIVSAVASAIAAGIGTLIAQIGAWWQQHGAEVVAIAQATWDEVSRIVTAAASIVMSLVTMLVGAVAAVWQQHGATIIAVAQQTWSVIVGIVQTAWNTISGIVGAAAAVLRGMLEALAAALRGNWQQAMDALVVGGRDAWQRLIGGLSAAGPQLLNALQTMVQGIHGAWQGLVNSAANLGAALISGITSGVQRAASDLARAVADAAWRALEEAKRALGISSPSRVAADLVGLPIAQGVAQGITQGQGMVATSGASLAQAALAPARATAVTVNAGITVQAAQGMREDVLAQRIRTEIDRLARQAALVRGG